MTDSFDRLKAALANRYTIQGQLGAGGMATVYLAEDLKHHRKVAVKVLRPELAAALGPERFLREIEISARLRHPHILPLYDSGEADGFLYYVMPHVAGESLRDRLDREQQLPIDDALQITGEVADALHYAHEQNVVHRDIKPENILLESGHAVVADFGIARAVAQAGGERLTGTGLSVGTPTYMSPEQASGGTEVDGRSDVFALATVLYEMLVGEPPFTGPNAQAIIAKTLTGDVPPLAGRRSTVSASLDRAVIRALARVPADRFATAGKFATALKGLATTEATGAPLRAPTGRLRPALAGAGIVAIAVVAWFFTRSELPTPADGDRPSMAVLPFENLGAPENEYFADGMAEEMISQLAEISGLLVRSRTSTLQYKGTTKTLTEIGGELRVDYVLEGTVRTDRSPDGTGQVRVTPQLIRVSDDTHLWTDRYTASLGPGEVFAVQAEIAEQVAAALNVTLLGDERDALGAAPTVNQKAYDTYLLGRYQWNQRTPATLLAAAEQFQRAIELDPTFAEAVVGLAETYAVFEPLAVPGYQGGEGYALAAAAARRAIALDSTLVGAHATLGYALTFGEWDWDAAESAFDRALALDPEYAVTYLASYSELGLN